jgi:Ni/Co efflux regulator RcnB
MHTQFKTIVITAILAAFFLIAASGASAKASIDDRQARQHHHIRKGIHAGALTRHEVGRLTYEQKKIAKVERRFRGSDDRFSRRERGRIHELLDQSAKHIRKALHNEHTP